MLTADWPGSSARYGKQTQDSLFDQPAGRGKRGGHSVAEDLAQLHRSGADGHEQGIRGPGIVEVAAQRQQLGRAQVMGGESLHSGGRLDGQKRDGSGSGIDRAIDEQDGLGAGDLLGQLGSPLLAGQLLSSNAEYKR